MAKARSPQYPAIGLSEAIEKIKMVYRKDVQNKIPKVVVAKHAGYNGLNGKSLGMLSALLKYGLLEGRGDESHVSDLALQIIAHPEGSPERVAAIKEAATRPTLFADINERFKDGRVSDEALRSYLLTQKFLPSAVDGAIRAYYDTILLVRGEIGGYDSSQDEESDHESQGTEMTQGMPARHRERPHEVGGVEVIRTRLTPTVTGMVEFRGPVTQGAIEKLVWYLEGVKDTYPQNGEPAGGNDQGRQTRKSIDD